MKIKRMVGYGLILFPVLFLAGMTVCAVAARVGIGIAIAGVVTASFIFICILAGVVLTESRS